MVIVDKRPKEATCFRDLNVGDAFVFRDELFIKTALVGKSGNAFCLNYNADRETARLFALNASVQKVELEIIIHEDGWGMDYLGNEHERIN